MKTLVIGNGSSVREHKLRNKIDSYDTVIRFNRGYFEGIKGYEDYVGTKTDILVVHDGYAKPEYIDYKVLDSVPVILVVIPKFKFYNEVHRIQSYDWGDDKVQFIPDDYETELNKMGNFGKGCP